MIYFDTSAAIKLAVRERESAALATYLANAGDRLFVSSALLFTELTRGVTRLRAECLPNAGVVLRSFDFVAISDPVLHTACAIGGAEVRTLDALHLATALMMTEDLTAFIAYDKRMADAATSLGLPVVTPT